MIASSSASSQSMPLSSDSTMPAASTAAEAAQAASSRRRSAKASGSSTIPTRLAMKCAASISARGTMLGEHVHRACSAGVTPETSSTIPQRWPAGRSRLGSTSFAPGRLRRRGPGRARATGAIAWRPASARPRPAARGSRRPGRRRGPRRWRAVPRYPERQQDHRLEHAEPGRHMADRWRPGRRYEHGEEGHPAHDGDIAGSSTQSASRPAPSPGSRATAARPRPAGPAGATQPAPGQLAAAPTGPATPVRRPPRARRWPPRSPALRAEEGRHRGWRQQEGRGRPPSPCPAPASSR